MSSRFVLLLSVCLLCSCTTVSHPLRAHLNADAKSIGGAVRTPKNEDILEQLKVLVSSSVQDPTKQQQESSRLLAVDTVENKLNPEQLELVARGSEFGFLRGHAMFRLGELALERKNTTSAKKYFLGINDFLPGSDLASRAEEIVGQIDAARNVEIQTVGVVLPLSGKNAPLGQRALRGLEMGLGLHLPGSAFKLAVMDSEGNPDSARRGVERLVREDNVIAIVGSLLSKTATAVAVKANELGVPNLALSQKSGLTDIGPTVFRNSLTSGMQVRALVRTAMDDLGMKRFAILYPNDPYGVEFSNIFWDEVLARGGEITAIQTYSNKETDFRLVVQRLVGTYFGEARQEEFSLRMRDLQHSEKKRSVRQSNLENILPPLVNFDALFIPDSVKAMGQIAAMLSYNDVRNIKLLGTNLWNTKDVVRRSGNFSSSLLFVDSISPQSSSSRFISEYKNLFNEDPTLIEIQAYDTGLILRQLIASGLSSREDLGRQLAALNRFPGALGPLRVNSEREVERPVYVLTVEKGEITPLKLRK